MSERKQLTTAELLARAPEVLALDAKATPIALARTLLPAYARALRDEHERAERLESVYKAAWTLADNCEEIANEAPAEDWDALRTALDEYEAVLAAPKEAPDARP